MKVDIDLPSTLTAKWLSGPYNPQTRDYGDAVIGIYFGGALLGFVPIPYGYDRKSPLDRESVNDIVATHLSRKLMV